jgi:catechol 2,3-dioxygenase-like lactoylglutathione lyase family enzyme
VGALSSDVQLGPVGHVGIVVADLPAAMVALARTGVRWSAVQHPVARLRLPHGLLQEIEVGYVAQSGGEPRLKLIEGTAGTYFTPAPGVHHVAYWVDDLDRATAHLVAAGHLVEATGEDPDGSARYRYLLGPAGLRIELGLQANRAAFDAWADA